MAALEWNDGGEVGANNALGRLTGATVAVGRTLVDPGEVVMSASYEYDAQDRRVAKTVNGVRTEYAYDGQNVVAEWVDGALRTRFVHGPGVDNVLAMLRDTGADGQAEAFYYLKDLKCSKNIFDQGLFEFTQYHSQEPGSMKPREGENREAEAIQGAWLAGTTLRG